MEKLETYKDRLSVLIKEAYEDGVEIQPYAERSVETGDVVEAGMALICGKDIVEIVTYVNEMVRVSS